MDRPADETRDTGAARPGPGDDGSLRRAWMAMAVLLTGNFMNLVDVTIVNVALPTLEQELDAAPNLIEWIVAAYTFAFALLLLPAGRAGDLFGRRRMFLAGITVFTVASALSGLAPNIEMLVLARAVQGAGGALMTPQTLALVPALFPPEKRGAVFGLFALAAGLASVSGPILGGLLIGADIGGLSWRPIFLVNIPVGALAILGALRYVPATGGQRDIGIDWTGIALGGLAVLAVLGPLIEAPAIGWRGWMTASVIAAPLLAWGFFRWELRQEARGRPQLLPMRLARQASFRTGTILAAILFSCIPGFFLIVALYLQAGYGLTPLMSGLTTTPFSVGVLVASPVASRLGDRYLARRVAAGCACLAVGLLGIEYAIATMGDQIRWLATAPWFLIGGFGLGTTVSPLFQVALRAADNRDSGSASGAVQSLQQVGSSFGVAIMGGIFFTTLGAARPGDAPVYADAAGRGIWYAVAAVVAIGLYALLRGVGPELRDGRAAPISGPEVPR